MPLLWISFLAGEKEGAGMSTLHILINPHTEKIVNAVHEHDMDGAKGLKGYIRHHVQQEGRSLARVIVKQGEPVKVIQAGEEET